MKKINIKTDYIEKIKNIKYKRQITIGLVILILLISLIISKKTMSPLEEKTMKTYSEEFSENLDIIDKKNNKLDSYVIYTLNYYKNNKNTSNVTIKELNKFISKHFTIETSEKKIYDLGITPTMVENNVTFTPETSEYKLIDTDLSYADIASRKITKYEEKNIKKLSKNKYKVTYQKYVVKDPYKILNYYLELNSKSEQNQAPSKKKLEVKKYDTTKIESYLKGTESQKSIKKYITKDNISKIGTDKGVTTVIYILEADNIKIKSINN